MDEFAVINEALSYPEDQWFIVEEQGMELLIDKLTSMGLVAYYDGVYWITYDGIAYAKWEMC